MLGLLTAGCNDFLDAQKPQGTLDDEQVLDPRYVDNLVISAYAGWISIEDINSSFSMWNYDVRSDDAYKGGNGTEDGDVFHALEISQGIMTTDWNISDMWDRLYKVISRANTALAVLDEMDSATYPQRDGRIAEMRFLRAHGHFLLKRLYKNIPFAIDEHMSPEEYNNLENTQYTNDEGWQVIIDDLKYAYDNLPAIQNEVGRPNRAAAAAYLAKVYLYKAYRQDDPKSNQVTSIDRDDLLNVVKYTEPTVMAASGCALEPDFHNNFRPEPIFENGPESIWAMQYSFNDGTNHGNCNWSYGLIVPNIPGVTDGGWEQGFSQKVIERFDASISRLGLYTDFKTLTPVSDYAYDYEQQYEVTLPYGGYLNRSLGCYTLNISSHIQRLWRAYQEAPIDPETGERQYTEAQKRMMTLYLAPGATDLFTFNRIALQGGIKAGENAPIHMELTYTLIK